MTRRHLEVAEIPTPGSTPQQVRHRIAGVLESIAAITRHGTEWEVDGSERDPVAAAVVVVFSTDGEPTPFAIGIEGDNWADWKLWHEIVGDAARAIHELRPSYVPTEHRDLSLYDRVHQWWLLRAQGRERHRAREAAKAAEYERSRPFLCDCGDRFATDRGLAQHRRMVHR